MTVVVYTDASYDKEKDIAACGYCVLVNRKLIKHQVLFLSGLGKVSQAEILSIVKALEYSFLVNGVSKIIVNTDYESIVKRVRAKKGFEEFDATMEIIKEHDIEVQLNHVRAHKGDRFNTLVDRSCLYGLREYLEKQKIKDAGSKNKGWNRHKPWR